jgi:hypothetical protein
VYLEILRLVVATPLLVVFTLKVVNKVLEGLNIRNVTVAPETATPLFLTVAVSVRLVVPVFSAVPVAVASIVRVLPATMVNVPLVKVSE